MPDRIQQGSDGQERLYTVRPRNAPSVTEKRGTASSMRFHIPEEITDITPYTQGRGIDSATASAFRNAVRTQGFINFIAQSVSYSIQEKSQVMHTFGGKEAVYFYGHAPVMVQLSGTIVDDLDNDQFAQFLGLYRNYLRGSKASQDYCYVELALNNISFTGAFMNISIQQSSDRDTDIQFSAQFLAKEFTIASTDTIFLENGTINQPVVMVRLPDPTLSQEAIQEVINANTTAALTAVANDTPNSDNSLATGGDGFFGSGSWTKSFGTLPTISGTFDFDASMVTDFFGDVTDTINNLLAPVTDLIGQIDALTGEILGIIEAVEDGIDDVINTVNSVTNQVYGTIEDVESLITKVSNFPDSMSSKLGSIGGSAGASAPRVIGGGGVGGNEASALLIPQSNIGASRGTPEGGAALLIVSKNNNQTASLVPSGSNDDDELPSLVPEPSPGLPLPLRIGG